MFYVMLTFSSTRLRACVYQLSTFQQSLHTVGTSLSHPLWELGQESKADLRTLQQEVFSLDRKCRLCLNTITLLDLKHVVSDLAVLGHKGLKGCLVTEISFHRIILG